eukprot:m.102222 g.102222  ORF g.102222 m.102222 type:complete len:1858 (+) comp37156_c0_seq6:100-5673(+)
MAAYLEPGARVWLSVDRQWEPAVIESSRGGQIVFKTEYGKSAAHKADACTHDLVTPMHQSSVDGVEDMATLSDLHEAAILFNIRNRYMKDRIYTFIGSILAAVNPYKAVGGLYGREMMEEYNRRHLGERPPHIYAIANEIYYCLWRMEENQCVLISGESGAGKTESTKFILRYLSELSQQSASEGVKGMGTGRVEDAILQSSPILEAFGNAKTVYNNNSSRFGKFIQLQFNKKGFIEGGRILDYLLEKNRVVRQNPAERNYHIFYALICGADENMRKSLQLYDPGKYHYLNQSGCVGDPTINDAADFQRVKTGMETMQFSEENMNDVFLVLAGVLHLGNMRFLTAGGAQIEDRKLLKFVAHLLSLDEYQFEDALTKRMMVMRGEEITTPLDLNQAADSRDSMAMALYATVFRWILKKINSRIRGQESFLFIGVLDIFGFENFQINRFEQFNINFANEKLQEYFNKHIFSLEQHEYNKEGIEWVEIDWVDNTECLDLIEKRLGILALLDEESRFPKGTDQTLLSKLHSAHAGNPYYVKPKVSGATFGIKHYAGEVMYDTTGLLDKNRDTFRDDILNTLKESRSDFIYDLFEHMESSSSDQQRGRSRARKKPTVSSQFKDSLHSLMSTLSQANPYFVRCIKPNSSKVCDIFEPDLVMSQLRYSGMMETVRIRRAGFPVRRLFEDFIFRYRVLARGLSGDSREVTGLVIKPFDETGTHWQLGKTKVFLREHLETLLEKEREKQLESVAQIIQAWMIGYLTRKRFLKTKRSIVVIQKNYRCHYFRKAYLKTRRAIIVLQRMTRGWSARKLYHQLLEERRLVEERRLEEERQREGERKRELERLEEERKTQELEEMKAQLAEEERQKKAAVEMKRRKSVEESKKALAKAKEIERMRRRQEEAEREAKERAEESSRMAEEAAIAAAEEAERLAQEEAARLEAEAEQAAISQIAELDSALRAAEEDSDEEEGEGTGLTLTTSSGTEVDEKKMESELASSVIEQKSVEGYLTMKAGSKWKRRWCVLKFGTFMYFRAKQDFIKAGWMEKKGGGTGTLSRRNWKRRFFVLRDDKKLSYYEKDEEGSKPLGVINIAEAKEILDQGSKAHSFGIEVIRRTYHIIAESEEDCRSWVSVLKKMQASSDEEAQAMKNNSVNPRNAAGTLDLPNIDSCTPLESKPTSFTIITTDRVLHFNADTVQDMNAWVVALQPSVFSDGEVGPSAAIEKGWLIKESVSKKLRTKRYFVLHDQGLDYYKSSDTSVPPVGQILLNSLCTAYQTEDTTGKDASHCSFIVSSRRRFYKLTAKTHAYAQQWIHAILDVIDSRPAIITPTEKLIDDIKDAKPNEVNAIYRINPILCYTSSQLKSSLLPLPYGNVQSPKAKSRGYGTLQEEALRLFNSLQDQESAGDPIPVIQGILQTCFDLPQLRNEVYCQLIKQTNTTQSDSIAVLRNWQVLACMCSSFLPSRKFVRYLRFHLKRYQETFPHTEMVKFANFCTEAIKRTRPRDYPPSREEIIACLGRRELTAVVHCFGGGTCKISISSATTAGEVVHKLSLGIGVMDSKNRFALFEQCGELSKAIEDRAVVADILAKFERYEAHGINEGGKRWRLFFKLFCFLDVNVSTDSLEFGFMFEQAYNDVIQSRFPAPTQTYVRLAALRIQHDVGDYKAGAWIPNLESVYPVKKKPTKEEDLSAMDKGFTLKGTLRGLGKGTLRKLKNMDHEDPTQKLADEAELQAIKVGITDQWKKLKGMSRDVAQQQYMDVVRSWKGYGSTLFDVEYKQDHRYPKDLWLAVNSRNVALYKRADLDPIVSYPYEQILSFGAPVANTYKLIVEGNIAVSVETQKVLEVAKLMKAYINAIVKERRTSVAQR